MNLNPNLGKKESEGILVLSSSYRTLLVVETDLLFFDRDIDEEKHSDSDLDPKIQTLPVAKTASDLNFSCKIDAVSETEIVDAVLSINYSIDILISNILVGVKEFKLSYYRNRSTRKGRNRHRIRSNPELDIPPLQCLLIDSPSLLSEDTRDYVVDIILHNLISSLVHKHFFKGGHFFGVGSKILHEGLETMFSNLVARGKYYFIMNVLSPLLLIIIQIIRIVPQLSVGAL